MATASLQQQAGGVRVILFTPTPYDEIQPGEESFNFRGVNQALGVLSGAVRGIASARGILCIDFHTPLSRLCQEGAPIICPDRVHPNADGEAAMTAVLLVLLR